MPPRIKHDGCLLGYYRQTVLMFIRMIMSRWTFKNWGIIDVDVVTLYVIKCFSPFKAITFKPQFDSI